MGGELPGSGWPAGPTVDTIGRVTRRLRGRREPPARRCALRLSRSDRRAQLLAAALVAFARDGIAATTMDSIAATAGVSKPLVYQYFANKRAALLAVVEQHCTALVAALGPTPPSGGVGGLRRQFGVYLDFARRHPVAFQLLFRSVDGTDGPASDRINATRRAVGTACALAAVGAVDGAPAWVGDALCALVEGVGLRLDAQADPDDLAHHLSRFVRLDQLRPRSEGAVARSGRAAAPADRGGR